MNTGGPRNSRTFYLRIRLFTMGKNVLKFGIRGILASFPSLIRDFLVKLGFKINSLIIRGFNISGTLAERIYRELRGPPVKYN